MWFSPRRGGERSVAAVRNVWANESIRQKIIGHKMAVGGYRPGRGLIRRSLDVGGAQVTFAQLEEHARDYGVGIFVDPLVEERIDFLAQIGGMTKTRKFVTVQRVAGSGEKEFPRRLGAAGGHGALRANRVTQNGLYLISIHSMITSNHRVTVLWKSVESEEKSARACSGCAGDYENPDRSAWEEDFEEVDEEFGEEASDEPRTVRCGGETAGRTRRRDVSAGTDATGDAPDGAAAVGGIRAMGDAGRVGGEDKVSAGEHFGTAAALAQSGVRRMGGREAAEGVGGGGVGVGVQIGGGRRVRN